MLNREQIATLIQSRQLISGYIDVDTQLTPNGFDLTVAQVHAFEGAGRLDFSNKERRLPETRQLAPEKHSEQDAFGWWTLSAGAYKIVTNEVVRLPKDHIAMAFPRSSLLRMGAFTQTGVWDAGFQGKSEFILLVTNPRGMQLKQNARVVQLLFVPIAETVNGYDGIYQERAP